MPWSPEAEASRDARALTASGAGPIESSPKVRRKPSLTRTAVPTRTDSVDPSARLTRTVTGKLCSSTRGTCRWKPTGATCDTCRRGPFDELWAKSAHSKGRGRGTKGAHRTRSNRVRTSVARGGAPMGTRSRSRNRRQAPHALHRESRGRPHERRATAGKQRARGRQRPDRSGTQTHAAQLGLRRNQTRTGASRLRDRERAGAGRAFGGELEADRIEAVGVGDGEHAADAAERVDDGAARRVGDQEFARRFARGDAHRAPPGHRAQT